MYRFACLIIALLASCSGAALPESRIVGGSVASTNQIPWQVSLRANNNHFCGGSIINQRWVLTAAHCLSGSVSTATVVTATLRLNSGGDRYRVSRFVLHPQYKSWTIRNDVGLVQTASNMIWHTNDQPARLPTRIFMDINAPAVVSGWGKTSSSGVLSNKLRFLNTFVTSTNDCFVASWRVTPENICTFLRAGQGNCHGDSGGPLTVDDVLISVASFRNLCTLGTSDVYVRVFIYTSIG